VRRLRPLLQETARRTAGSVRRWVAEPASCPPGWRTAAPDFVGVGAQRSGTQWWYGLITDHPQVQGVAATMRRLRPWEALDPERAIQSSPEAPIRRELHFFDSFADRSFERRDAELYRRFFPRPEGELCGEWTPRYMLDFWAPRLLRLAAPRARLLVLLRDPVERYLSGLSAAAPRARERGIPLAWMPTGDAVMRGLYARQLAVLLEHFERDQVLVLQYERCCQDPAGELRRTYEFLRVDAGHRPADLRRQAGPARPKPELPPEAREDLVGALAGDVRELVGGWPEIDVKLWPNFRDVI
jgi:hypothetical protein